MAKTCVITKKSSLTAGRYSNRTRATQFNAGVKRGKIRRKANIQKRRLLDEQTGKYYSVQISTSGLKTVRKNGVHESLKKAGVIK